MRLVCFFISLCCFSLHGQQILDDNIQQLIDAYSNESKIKCEITVTIHVEGMQIPRKTILVDFQEGQKPKVKGEGLALLPKKGLVNQFQELFKTPMQAIAMGEKEGRLVYKLVSLDDQSQWVTADIVFNKDTFQIYEAIINTRKHGALKAIHTYEEGKYPSESLITFSVKKFKVPLRFIGRQNKLVDLPEADEQTEGKIFLQYVYIP
ncbi:hypothetical protein KH5_06010 [Urechidicola sp. KH5]